MADTKTSLETAAAALTGAELVPGVQSGADVKITATQIATLASSVRTSLFNAQVGTSYTVVAADGTKEVTLLNAAAIASSIAQAGTGGFGAGWFVDLKCLGAGAVTLTPTTSTINGAATLVLTTGMWARVWSDGSNYLATVVTPAGVAVNPQTGTSYTYVSADRGKLVTHTNAAAMAGTLPQATGAFGAAWAVWVQNRGAGTLTVTPTTSTIDGAASLALTTGQGCLIASDGTNYYTMRGIGGAGGGSLTNFTESVNSATPNATVPVVRLLATNAATNVDAVFSAKGTGSLLASSPDNTVAGGNKRGTNTVDWQTLRNSAADVAASNGSVIAGGNGNGIASGGNFCVIGGGASNSIAGGCTYAGIASGSSNSLTTGNYGFIGGGQSNTASGSNAAILGGASCDFSGVHNMGGGSSVTISANYAVGWGRDLTVNGVSSSCRGAYAHARGIHGADAWASAGRSSQVGQAQRRNFVLSGRTTNATTLPLTTDQTTASAANQICVPSSGVFRLEGQMVARLSTGAVAGWSFKALAKNVAGTLTLTGSVVMVDSYNEAFAVAYTVAFSADATNKAMQLSVTGGAADTVDWVAAISTVEEVA